MCYCNNDNISVNDSIDNPERKATHQKEPVTCIAEWKPFGGRLDLIQRRMQLRIKIIRCVETTLSIPA